jgi:hypothetical protein
MLDPVPVASRTEATTTSVQLQSHTSRKNSFHSSLLVPNVFGPRLNGSLVPIHLKMWAREHLSRFKWALLSRFASPTGTNAFGPLVPARGANRDYRAPFSLGLLHKPRLKGSLNKSPLSRASYDRFGIAVAITIASVICKTHRER